MHQTQILYRPSRISDAMRTCLLLLILIADVLGACINLPGQIPRPAREAAVSARADTAFAPIEASIRAQNGPDASGLMPLDSNEQGLTWRLALIDSVRHSLDPQYFRDLDVLGIGPVARHASAVFNRFRNSEWAVPAASLGLGATPRNLDRLAGPVREQLAAAPSLTRLPPARPEMAVGVADLSLLSFPRLST